MNVGPVAHATDQGHKGLLEGIAADKEVRSQGGMALLVRKGMVAPGMTGLRVLRIHREHEVANSQAGHRVNAPHAKRMTAPLDHKVTAPNANRGTPNVINNGTTGLRVSATVLPLNRTRHPRNATLQQHRTTPPCPANYSARMLPSQRRKRTPRKAGYWVGSVRSSGSTIVHVRLSFSSHAEHSLRERVPVASHHHICSRDQIRSEHCHWIATVLRSIFFVERRTVRS